MSYSSVFVDKNPYFYFPMSARLENDFPLDFSSNSTSVVNGFFSYEHVNDYLGSFVHLFDGSSLEILDFGDNLSDFTLGFWVFTTKNTKNIISIAGAQIEAEYSEGNVSIIVNSSPAASFAEKELVNIVVSVTNSTGIVYVNGQNVATFTSSEPESIIFSSNGEIFASHVYFFQSLLSEDEISALFDLGATASEIIKIDSESEISFFGDLKSHFQTTWQAYGIITTKR